MRGSAASSIEMSDGACRPLPPPRLDVRELNAGSGWELPVPASYVAGRDGVIGFAFADPDWSRRAEPAELVARSCSA